VRAVSLVLTPPKGTHPAERVFDADSGVSRERIYHVNVLDDGTAVLLGRLRGDLDLARRRIEERPETLGYSISEDGEGGLVYVHTRPPPAVRRFLELPRVHEVFFQFPIEGTRDGRLRVTVAGESNEVLGRALADVPEGIGVDVEWLGPYPADPGDATTLLTDRQREVLDVALDLGYYETPREATHGDIAERLGLAVGTVTEHLQKVEARVFGALAGREGRDDSGRPRT
jgi:DNA-binding CsgD family transcriptional regulator